jgi:hypothetical protein
VRWQLVARIAQHGLAAFGQLLAQARDFAQQQIDLLLLAVDRGVELLQQVFGVAGLDLEFCQAGVGVVQGVHARIGPEKRRARSLPRISACPTPSR